MPALLLLFATIVALVLNSRGKLVGPDTVTSVLFSPDGYNTPNLQKFSTFALAFFGYVLAISFMNDREAVWLTAILVLGALFWNVQTNPGASVLDVLFLPAPTDETGDGFKAFTPKPGDIRPVPNTTGGG